MVEGFCCDEGGGGEKGEDGEDENGEREDGEGKAIGEDGGENGKRYGSYAILREATWGKVGGVWGRGRGGEWDRGWWW